MAILWYFIYIQNIQKYIQNIYNIYIYKIVGGGWLAGPARAKPGAAHGPDRGPRLGAGPGRAAPPPLGILYISCIYFGIFCMYIKYHKMAIVMACFNCYGIPNLLVTVEKIVV